MEKDIIAIGTVIWHTKIDEHWMINDCYFNLLTKECEFMAESLTNDKRGALYIPQEVMLRNLKDGTFIVCTEEEVKQ